MRTTALLLSLALASPALAAPLESTLGRNETRILSAPFAVVPGKSVQDLKLDERLERLGYTRVRNRPDRPGEYFHGTDVYWFYRRPCHANGSDQPAALIGLDLGKNGAIGGLRSNGRSRSFEEGDVWLEPEILAESLDGKRADRVRVELDRLPEKVWRPVLAAEDARFFEHGGVDPRSIARAALKNLRKGKVAEGGSTITQQLVKNRDLTPERTLGRKASEAMRALSLEAEYDKKEILQAYLNTIYFGHVDAIAIYGFGTAARAYFGKDAAKLTLAESAALAAMIQGPNRLSPLKDEKALRNRRDWVLSRMEELGWATGAEVAIAKASGVAEKPTKPKVTSPGHLLSWLGTDGKRLEQERVEEGKGFLVETTVDPVLQEAAEGVVASHLDTLRRLYPRLKGAKLSSALVALDARTGAVLAYVGGDPDDRAGSFDRARLAKRQPGSVVKPFVALEALDTCDGKTPLTASSRILDEPLTIDLPKGPWEPKNFDEEFRGPVLLREALAESRNVPAVRIARHCGFDRVAATFREAGLDLPASPPPSFVLGAIETSPLAVARAYTVLATPGKRLEPYAWTYMETPGGRSLATKKAAALKVADPSSAYLVRDLLRSAVEEGTATSGALEGVEVAAKTGTSSELRDAWFAGVAGSVVTVVWVGLDDAGKLGLTGAAAAGPVWHDFMAKAVPARADHALERPRDVVEMWVQERTGLLVREGRLGARAELYRKGTLPPKKRWWKIDTPMEPIE
ncbi:MAG TPA: transglycosylase domain-containing protein [Candidatus Polarisedimenticolaceae bacterium]